MRRVIRHRDDLVDLAIAAAPTTAAANAIRRGNFQALGGFAPPGGLPYFVVEFWTDRGRRWTMAITPLDMTGRNRCRLVAPIALPWEHWAGRHRKRPWHPVTGDLPETCVMRKMKARRHHGRTT